MKDNQAKYPQLRFKGFTDPWEERKLGELGSVAMNRRIFKDQTSENEEVPFFKIGTFGSKPDAFISRELFEEYKLKYPYPEIGDILISASGSIGRTVVYQGEDEYFQDSNIVWLKHDNRLDNKFLKQFYSIVKWQGLEGSTIKRLYNKNILDTDISIPSTIEQNKIGMFFEQLDDTIALHQRKLAKLKELKQGYLQKLFPENGSKFPQLRFAGFADNCEERKLGDLVNVDTGARNHQDAVQGGRYPFYVRSENIEALDEYDFDETAILVPGDGRIGEIFHFVQGKFALHQRVYKLDGFTGVMPEFLIQLLRHGFRKHALRMNAQGTVPSLRKPVFTEWQVLIPNTKEQKPISYLLRCLDKTITLHQRKLEKLQELKKGYLQKMFC